MKDIFVFKWQLLLGEIKLNSIKNEYFEIQLFELWIPMFRRISFNASWRFLIKLFHTPVFYPSITGLTSQEHFKSLFCNVKIMSSQDDVCEQRENFWFLEVGIKHSHSENTGLVPNTICFWLCRHDPRRLS